MVVWLWPPPTWREPKPHLFSALRERGSYSQELFDQTYKSEEVIFSAEKSLTHCPFRLHEQPKRQVSAQPEMGLYESLPLHHRSSYIRVLDLKPDIWNANLQATIRVVDLHSEPKYEALSYTWGDAFESRTIQLNNGCQLGVTDNLYKALRRLRRPLASRTLWVDALCINQNDIDERGRQVSIMGQIYKSALNVLVWLGEYKNASRLDPWLMRLPHKSNGYERTGHLNGRGTKFAGTLNDALQQVGPQWIDRAWIVQEFVLSRKIIFCFGPLTIDHEEFLGPHKQYPRCDPVWIAHYVPTEIKYQQLALFYDKLDSMRTLQLKLQKRDLSLFDAISSTGGTECKDSRDKIFSLLGLLTTEEAHLIQPNYHDTFAQVFIRATFASIITQHDFKIFALVTVQRPWLTDDLPTWVPDFRVKFAPRLQDFLDGFYSNLALPITLSLNTMPLRIRDTGLLTLYGSFLGRVVSFVILPDRGKYFGDRFWQDVFTQLRVSFTIRDLRAESAREKWPIANFDPSQVGRPSHETWMTENVIRAIFAFWDETAGFMACNFGSRMPFWACEDDELTRRGYGQAKSSSFYQFWQYADFVGGGSVLFVSSSGHVGLAPKTVKPGDHVTIVPGCKMPVILRSTGTAYDFRGLAHVHCISGNLTDQVEHPGLKTKALFIR